MMKWALIATEEKQIMMFNQETYEWQQITVQPGTIVNIVIYEEGSDWMPPQGTRLEQVPDTANIGDTGYN